MGILSRISQWLLQRLVRADIQGIEYLENHPDVVYVLETNRFSHRLLLQSLLRQQQITLPRQRILSASHQQNPLLRARLEAQIEKLGFSAPHSDIRLLPVSIYHGRMPTRQASLLNLIYAETWDRAGWLGRAMQLLVNGRQTLIQIDPPLSLRQLQQELPNQPSGVIAHKVARVFHNHFHRRRQAIVGPTLVDRNALIELILQQPPVRQAIAEYAHAQQRPIISAHRHARTLLRGIAANFSPTMARLLAPLLGVFWRKIYDSVQIQGLARLQQCAPDHQLVYLPCHRSHMDYVILSWSLYQHGLMLPHIAAGDNLNTPLLGSILKRGGAFFMRRQFRDDPLYAVLFKHYMGFLAARGHSLEYFIEGGRSRTGRLLPAKTGLLSMTLENYQHSAGKPLALVPVWISYDRLVESKSYRQQLDGKQKRGESFWGLLKTLRMFTGQFGDAALSFAEPITLTRGANLATASRAIAEQVMQRINLASWANQSALLATVLLANPKQTFTRAQLSQQVQALTQLLQQLPNAPVAIPEQPVDLWIDAALARDQLSDQDGQLYLSEQQAQEMTFYRNQLHHISLLPGICLLLVSRYPRALPALLPHLFTPLYPYLQAELSLPWQLSELDEVLPKSLHALQKVQLLSSHQRRLRVCQTPLAYVLMQGAEPVLLRYYLVFRLLSWGHPLSYQDLLEESQRIASALHQRFGFHSPEYSDQGVLSLFIATLQQQQVITEQQGALTSQINPHPLIKRARQILNRQYVAFIETQLAPR